MDPVLGPSLHFVRLSQVAGSIPWNPPEITEPFGVVKGHKYVTLEIFTQGEFLYQNHLMYPMYGRSCKLKIKVF